MVDTTALLAEYEACTSHRRLLQERLDVALADYLKAIDDENIARVALVEQMETR